MKYCYSNLDTIYAKGLCLDVAGLVIFYTRHRFLSLTLRECEIKCDGVVTL